MSKRLTADEKKLICDLYESGKEATAISEFMKRGESTVYMVLQEFNIKKHDKARTENARARWGGVETRDAKQIKFDELPETAPRQNDGLPFAWNYKNKNARRNVAGDVTITASGKTASGIKQVYFNIRNKCFLKIGATGYAVFAVWNSRIYFKSVPAESGYKLTKAREVMDTRYMTCPATDEIHEFIKNNTGDYKLHFDPVYSLYYIDTDEKGDC